MRKPFKTRSSSKRVAEPNPPHAPDLLRGGATANQSPSPDDLVDFAHAIIAARSRRKEFLPPDLFAELAWEMLLALYSAEAAGHRMTVSNLCRASEGPITTSLRWLDKLEEMGLVVRRANPLDMRVAFVELTAESRARLQDYLMAAWKSFVEAP